MSTYAIGDVQGCYTTLCRLLETIAFDPKHDTLWFLGDIVNRGPDSLATVRLIRELGPAANMVLGNHDIGLLALHYGTHHRFKHNLDAILQAQDRDEIMAWLRSRPLAHYVPEHKFLLVHAGVPPQWDLPETLAHAEQVAAVLQTGEVSAFHELFRNDPAHWDEAHLPADRLSYTLNALTRMRFCDPTGTLYLKLKGKQTKQAGAYPWFRAPGRRTCDLRVVFGHWAALVGKSDTPNIHAIDTGCVWGGQLTCLDLATLKRTSIAYCG